MYLLDVLLSLPESLVDLVLTSWLRVQDVGRTDAAVCSRENRSAFLRQAYRGGQLYSTSQFMKIMCDYPRLYKRAALMQWAFARGAAICTIQVNKFFCTERKKRQDYLRLNGACVQSIVFDESSEELNITDALYDLLQYCPYVMEFECGRKLTALDYSTIVQKWPKLEALAMCKDCDLDSVRIVKLLCQSLKRFDGGCNDGSLLIGGWTDLLSKIGAKLHSFRCEVGGPHDSDPLASVVANWCPNLRTYDVNCDRRRWQWNLRSAELRTLLQGCPQLTALNIHTARLNSEGLRVLAERGAGLFSLEICTSGCTDGDMVGMLRTCRQLRTLRLHYSGLFSNDTFAAVEQYCTLLEDLELGVQFDLADSGICSIAQGCSHLRRLSIRHTQITHHGLKVLLRSCVHLVHLAVDDCNNIGGDGIRDIPKLRPGITDLSILGANITYSDLSDLVHRLRHLRHIEVDEHLLLYCGNALRPSVLVTTH